MVDAFYLPQGDGRFRSTERTAGPWTPDAQHAGPPSALLARAVEQCGPRDDVLVARMTCEILGPVPVAELEVRARVLRPGRSVELVEAALAADGRDVMRATSWRVRRAEVDHATGRAPDPLPERTDDDREGFPGYLGAVEWRYVRGRFEEPGPAAAWTRLGVAVVADEEPTPLQRVMAVADSGNGISQVLAFEHWWFINPELTVHVHREAQGEWVLLDAETTISAGGVGLARSTLSDQQGWVAAGSQSLYVARR